MSRKKIGPNHFLHRSTSVMIFFIVFLGFQIFSYLMRHIMLRIQTHLHSVYMFVFPLISEENGSLSFSVFLSISLTLILSWFIVILIASLYIWFLHYVWRYVIMCFLPINIKRKNCIYYLPNFSFNWLEKLKLPRILITKLDTMFILSW